MKDIIEEIRERWASRAWPSIGYFVHAQAWKDIKILLEEIDRLKGERQ